MSLGVRLGLRWKTLIRVIIYLFKYKSVHAISYTCIYTYALFSLEKATTPCTTDYDTTIDGITTDEAIVSGSDVEPCRHLCATRGAVAFVFSRSTLNCYCSDHYSTKPRRGVTSGTTSCIDVGNESFQFVNTRIQTIKQLHIKYG